MDEAATPQFLFGHQTTERVAKTLTEKVLGVGGEEMDMTQLREYNRSEMNTVLWKLTGVEWDESRDTEQRREWERLSRKEKDEFRKGVNQVEQRLLTARKP